MQDLIIIGAGPAGSSAAVYAQRFNMKTEVIYDLIGGLITQAHKVENWPGIRSISGPELGMQLFTHAQELGAEMTAAHVEKISQIGSGTFRVQTSQGEKEAKAVLITTGTFPRKLEIPGEDELQGRGVSYCAVCDAGFFKGKKVVVIGGSDSAVNDAEMLSQHCEKVYIAYRREQLRAEPANIKAIENNPKIEVIYKVSPQEIKGTDKVEKIVFDDGRELEIDGVFVAIGREPLTGMLDNVRVDFTNKGEIKVDDKKMTATPGIFAAGDVTPGIKQAITAAGYAVEAVFGVRAWLKGIKE